MTVVGRTWDRLTIPGKILAVVIPLGAVLTAGLAILIAVVGGALVQREHIAEEVAAGKKIGRHEPLRQEGEPRAGVAIGMPGAEYLDQAAVDVAEVEQAFDQRGLAGAIDADQAEGHSSGDLEVDPLQHHLAAIVFPDLVKADSRLRHWMR